MVYVEVRRQCIRARSPSMMWVLGLNKDVRRDASAPSHLTCPIQLMECTRLFPELLRTGVIMNICTICMQQGSQREPEITVICKPTLRICFQAFAGKTIRPHSVRSRSVWDQEQPFKNLKAMLPSQIASLFTVPLPEAIAPSWPFSP